MGLAPVDAAGVGQPKRIDQNGDAYQQRIREGAHLEIPQSGLDRSRNDSKERLATNTGLSQDDAAKDRGEAWEKRGLQVWERYAQGGERKKQPSSGAVVIDQGRRDTSPPGPLVKRPQRPADEDSESWTAWKRAHVGAAESEEYAQDQLSPFLKTPRQGRRRYALLNSR
jgi:hypothetical protein